LKSAILGICITAIFLSLGCSTSSTSAIKPADIAGKTDPTQRAQIHTERAAEYYKLGRHAIALEAVRQAISAEPKYAPAYNMLALIHMELGENDKAEAAFEQAIRITPNDSGLLNNYGWFICQRLDAKRSLNYFERAIKDPLYTTPERAFYNAGVCAKRSSDLVAAQNYFSQSLKRNSQFAPSQFELAELAYVQMRFKDADSLFSRFTGMVREQDAPSLLLGAKIARAMGDRNAEANYISQLKRRFPDSTQARDASLR
jgi:type IV pilus assembly protein PilF